MKSITNDIYYTLLCDCKTISSESRKCGKAGLRATQPGGAVRAPHSTKHSTPLGLPSLNLKTCQDQLFHNIAPIKIFPHDSLLTGTQHTTGTPHARRPVNAMKPRDGEKPGAPRHPPEGQRYTTPLLVLHTVKTREQSEANDPGERDSGRRLRGEVTSASASPPPPARRQPPSPITQHQ